MTFPDEVVRKIAGLSEPDRKALIYEVHTELAKMSVIYIANPKQFNSIQFETRLASGNSLTQTSLFNELLKISLGHHLAEVVLIKHFGEIEG